jgi:hypothetical protein
MATVKTEEEDDDFRNISAGEGGGQQEGRVAGRKIDASEAPLIEHLIECARRYFASPDSSPPHRRFTSPRHPVLLVQPFKWAPADVSLISISCSVFLVKVKIAFRRAVMLR